MTVSRPGYSKARAYSLGNRS